MGKNKSTNSTIWITTSVDTINQEMYVATETYEAEVIMSSDVVASQLSTKYAGANEKTKVFTPTTRKQEELLDINEKLQNLEWCI